MRILRAVWYAGCSMFGFCWHKYGKWVTYRWHGTIYGSKGYLLTGDMTPRRVSRTMQARSCVYCGKEVHRLVANADGAALAEEARKLDLEGMNVNMTVKE